MAKNASVDFYLTSDFETTKSNEKGEVRVHTACLIDSEGNEYVCTYLSDYIKKVSCFPHKTKIFFHNLSFDAKFLLSWILEHRPFLKIDVVRQGSKIIMVHVFFKENHKVTFYCTTLAYPSCSLSEIGKIVGVRKWEDTEELVNRDYFYESQEKDQQYCLQDCRVLMEGVKRAKANLIEKNIKTPSVSMAGQAYEILRSYCNMPKVCYRTFKKYYYGGYTESYFDPTKVYNDLVDVDFNSMYTYIQMKNDFGLEAKARPLEEFVKSGQTDIDFLVGLKVINIRLKSNYHPFLYKPYTTYKVIAENIAYLYLTKYDYEIFRTSYEFDSFEVVEYFEITRDFTSKNCLIWKEYLEERSKHKKGTYENYYFKTIPNSGYGACGINPYKKIEKPYLNEHGILSFKMLGMEFKSDMERNILFALQVTSYGRWMMFNLFLTLKKHIPISNIGYYDTDGLTFIADENELVGITESLKIGDDVGELKLVRYKEAKFLGKKRYIAVDDFGNYKVRVTGHNSSKDLSKWIEQVLPNGALEDFTPDSKAKSLEATDRIGGVELQTKEKRIGGNYKTQVYDYSKAVCSSCEAVFFTQKETECVTCQFKSSGKVVDRFLKI